MLPSILTMRPIPVDVTQPQTITFPPPCFTSFLTYLSSNPSPGFLQHQRRPSDPNKLNFDSSLNMTDFRFSAVQCACTSAHSSHRFLCASDKKGLVRRTYAFNPHLVSLFRIVSACRFGKYCLWRSATSCAWVLANFLAAMRTSWVVNLRGWPVFFFYESKFILDSFIFWVFPVRFLRWLAAIVNIFPRSRVCLCD